MTARLPDAYFDAMYATSDDPWQLSSRWYEERKYAVMLPRPRWATPIGGFAPRAAGSRST
jgi:hypothetical protein